uniref:Uncharacterized protein n=1 Tax=Timema cristinae TaxID=61476 RepID=A0A7R9CCG1_TIMCR|nr:unnamed protein product [Timema cristinae]
MISKLLTDQADEGDNLINRTRRSSHHQGRRPGKHFRGTVAHAVHWDTPPSPDNFYSYNFDLAQGPIFLRWMEGATTYVHNCWTETFWTEGTRWLFYWISLLTTRSLASLATQLLNHSLARQFEHLVAQSLARQFGHPVAQSLASLGTQSLSRSPV